ncbi:MAG: hypothetical protein EOP58_00105 [Sphingomonadales bacterium]|nr:MAG: hypothetical protein EOP58_00105 [Sphingomonadales bacterium]
MALLSIFASNPHAVDQLSIEQVVSMAGDGQLRDDSQCSKELREYVSQIQTTKIAAYIEHCLSTSFPKGGIVLQDLVNELGRRLDYDVVDGRYQGIVGGIGFDGLWSSPEGHSLVAEVKTTDAYRLSLDTLANYRAKLAAAGRLTPNSSILIIVGRQDTGELEAQIRGSRHAWDVRVISAEALIKLVQLKENSEALETGLKIRSLLIPVEYTRLDRMVDVMFTTAADVESSPLAAAPVAPIEPGALAPVADGQPATKNSFQFTDSKLLQATREQIVEALAERENVALVRKSRALYWNAHHDTRVACSISKRYEGGSPYWYAFHPAWDDFLSEGTRSFFVLGCMDRSEAFVIPVDELKPLLPFLNTTTTKEGSTYWHIHLVERASGVEMLVPKRSDNLSVQAFALPVSALPLSQ